MSFSFKEANFCRYRSTTRFFLCARNQQYLTLIDTAVQILILQFGMSTIQRNSSLHLWLLDTLYAIKKVLPPIHSSRTHTPGARTSRAHSLAAAPPHHHHRDIAMTTLLTSHCSLTHSFTETQSLTHLARSHNTRQHHHIIFVALTPPATRPLPTPASLTLTHSLTHFADTH